MILENLLYLPATKISFSFSHFGIKFLLPLGEISHFGLVNIQRSSWVSDLCLAKRFASTGIFTVGQWKNNVESGGQGYIDALLLVYNFIVITLSLKNKHSLYSVSNAHLLRYILCD